MQSKFTASQSIELAVPGQVTAMQHYLRQPQRLVEALVDPSRIELLGHDCFRLKMRPLSFMTLSIQPTVDLQVWTTPKGTLNLRSIASEIRGVEYINERFSLNLVGVLTPVPVADTTQLIGKADLEVNVDIPPALWLTPRPILDATGNGLLKSVLMTVKQRLSHQLLTDYSRWVAAQGESVGGAIASRAIA